MNNNLEQSRLHLNSINTFPAACTENSTRLASFLRQRVFIKLKFELQKDSRKPAKRKRCTFFYVTLYALLFLILIISEIIQILSKTKKL